LPYTFTRGLVTQFLSTLLPLVSRLSSHFTTTGFTVYYVSWTLSFASCFHSRWFTPGYVLFAFTYAHFGLILDRLHAHCPAPLFHLSVPRTTTLRCAHYNSRSLRTARSSRRIYLCARTPHISFIANSLRVIALVRIFFTRCLISLVAFVGFSFTRTRGSLYVLALFLFTHSISLQHGWLCWTCRLRFTSGCCLPCCIHLVPLFGCPVRARYRTHFDVTFTLRLHLDIYVRCLTFVLRCVRSLRFFTRSTRSRSFSYRTLFTLPHAPHVVTVRFLAERRTVALPYTLRLRFAFILASFVPAGSSHSFLHTLPVAVVVAAFAGAPRLVSVCLTSHTHTFTAHCTHATISLHTLRLARSDARVHLVLPGLVLSFLNAVWFTAYIAFGFTCVPRFLRFALAWLPHARHFLLSPFGTLPVPSLRARFRATAHHFTLGLTFTLGLHVAFAGWFGLPFRLHKFGHSAFAVSYTRHLCTFTAVTSVLHLLTHSLRSARLHTAHTRFGYTIPHGSRLHTHWSPHTRTAHTAPRAAPVLHISPPRALVRLLPASGYLCIVLRFTPLWLHAVTIVLWTQDYTRWVRLRTLPRVRVRRTHVFFRDLTCLPGCLPRTFTGSHYSSIYARGLPLPSLPHTTRLVYHGFRFLISVTLVGSRLSAPHARSHGLHGYLLRLLVPQFSCRLVHGSFVARLRAHLTRSAHTFPLLPLVRRLHAHIVCASPRAPHAPSLPRRWFHRASPLRLVFALRDFRLVPLCLHRSRLLRIPRHRLHHILVALLVLTLHT